MEANASIMAAIDGFMMLDLKMKSGVSRRCDLMVLNERNLKLASIISKKDCGEDW